MKNYGYRKILHVNDMNEDFTILDIRGINVFTPYFFILYLSPLMERIQLQRELLASMKAGIS